ncbi:acetamidase/formamidase family protein [Pseudoxanthomonas sacheonensis]|uniref:acetamidase/formamidase family protein n=1 Tax=Pseudoxanthomonas sacheonensis TaxID=443615 RepID=UPI0013D51EFB|nr:acetamidase/formamidase family protein [Pseudoxanthomonas sacheonensis]KAF1712810.1 acetamidase [Pseudoxanthomonas sacheonensis]
MKYRLALLLLLLALWTTGKAAEPAGQWLVTTDLWGNAVYQLLELPDGDGALVGVFDGDPLKGSRKGQALEFVVTGQDAAVYRFSGVQTQEEITGTADYPDTNNKDQRATHSFSARRLPQRKDDSPQRHEFVPSDYSNEFSPHRAPVLTIWPGDTVHTTTLDSGGVNQHGKTQALFGNPQTGPFYVMGAGPGDVLAIRIKRLRLNRDYADSLDSVVGRALSPALAAKATELGKPVRWKLDRERGVARPESPSPQLRDLSVPLRPMLGGLAVAPGFGSAPISTGDTGRFGGNMDFNEIREGATVYLPVSQPGALLYLGDAHALQGDGETSQYGLETSMDVEFSVDVLHKKNISAPRVESDTQIMVLGQAGSLDDALRSATTGMVQWLQQDYGLTVSECAQVMGSSVHYVVANLAGRSVGLAAKLDKSVLRTLSPKSP